MLSSDQIRPAVFPDVSPTDMPTNTNFSMAAGDFLEIYDTPGLFIKQYSRLFLRPLCSGFIADLSSEQLSPPFL